MLLNNSDNFRINYFFLVFLGCYLLEPLNLALATGTLKIPEYKIEI
jgi:hypothetical protein